MAQEYVAMYRSRWSDDEDWRALSWSAQWLYDFLAQHPDRNEAGLLSFTIKKWTRFADGVTVADLRRSLGELDDAGFIVVDEETEEVLVRSFIRRATVYKHIRLFRNACVAIRAVESERIRSALGQELVRLPKLAIPTPNDRNQRNVAEAVEAQRWLDELASQLCDAPPDPPGQGHDDGDSHPMAHPISHPMAHPYRVGAGVGVGAVPSSSPTSEKKSLESNAHEKKPHNVIPGRFGEAS